MRISGKVPAAVLVCVCLLLPVVAVAGPEIGSPESVLPPCYVPTDVDTSGWQAIRWLGGGRERFVLHIPPAFRRDEKVRFEHGGEVWVDGRRRLTQYSGYGSYTCVPDARNPGCLECTTLIGGGPRLRIDTTYDSKDSLYRVAAIDPADGGAFMFSMLIAESPDSADQRLFLTAIRTIQKASALIRTGALFGRVTQQDGTAAPNASVQLLGFQLEGKADRAGNYSIPLIPIGGYWVEAHAPGFAPGRLTVWVDPGRTTRVDIKLGPAKP